MLKRVLALLMVLSLALPAFAESRYTDAVSAGEGFFAYVPSETQAFGDEGSFGGAYSEPLVVYVDAAGNETKIAHGFITEALEGSIVVRYSAEAYVHRYLIAGIGGKVLARVDSIEGFDGASYSVARSGESFGIIDQRGLFVVPATFKQITRDQSDVYAGYDRAPFFCTSAIDGGITVLDCDSLETIGRYTEVDSYLRASFVNPSLFMVENRSKRSWCSMETGDVLFSLMIRQDARDFAQPSFEPLNANGSFRYVEGLPECLVITRGEDADAKSYLADNHGVRISLDFQSLIPLVWANGKGLFLFETFDPAVEPQPTPAEDWDTPYDPIAIYGDSYRCGLVDETGAIVAPAQYVGHQCVEGSVVLEEAGGQTYTISIQ